MPLQKQPPPFIVLHHHANVGTLSKIREAYVMAYCSENSLLELGSESSYRYFTNTLTILLLLRLYYYYYYCYCYYYYYYTTMLPTQTKSSGPWRLFMNGPPAMAVQGEFLHLSGVDPPPDPVASQPCRQAHMLSNSRAPCCSWPLQG